VKIAIVVHGRFHAFDLARELHKQGHHVTLFTNYPAFIAARFGVPAKCVRSFLLHGLLSRAAWKVWPRGGGGLVDRCANVAFGRWAARALAREDWDAVYAFSGVCEEIFQALRGRATFCFLARGSCHIACQRRLLEEEQQRVGAWVEKPSEWMVAREEREYELADAIQVLGSFPHRSFVERGVDQRKLYMVRLGVDVRAFRASPAQVQARQARLRSGEPLHILNVGTFSLRKGAHDFLELLRQLDPARFRWRFVGAIAADARGYAQAARGLAEFVGKKPQADLPAAYSWGDVFMLPSIEDGFGLVIAQALAAALPVLTTCNTGAADLIENNRNGWVVAPRQPEVLRERLLWCDAHREQLAEMVTAAQQTGVAWDWAQTAQQTEQSMRQALAVKTAAGLTAGDGHRAAGGRVLANGPPAGDPGAELLDR
jgi:glycosyltransferase involved in cell wall biosynthesis